MGSNVESAEITFDHAPHFQLKTGHTNKITKTLFTPDGKQLVTISDNMSFKIWNVASTRLDLIISGLKSNLHDFSISPDGKMIASSHLDQSIRFWELKTGKLIRQIDEVGRFCSLTFNASGNLLYTGDQYGLIKMFDPETGELQRTFNTDAILMKQFALSPDETTLVSIGRYNWARYTSNMAIAWNLKTKKITSISHSGPGNAHTSVAISSNSKLAAVGDLIGSIEVWDLITRKTIVHFSNCGGTHCKPVNSVEFSPSTFFLVTSDQAEGVKVWDLEEKDLVWNRTEKKKVKAGNRIVANATFSPDGSVIASSRNGEKCLTIFEKQTGRILKEIPGSNETIDMLAFTGSNQFVTTSQDKKEIHIWDADSGKRMPSLQGHNEKIHLSVINKKKNLLATLDFSGVLNVWDLETLSLKKIIKTEININDIAFSPENSKIAAMSDYILEMWERSIVIKLLT